MMIEIGKVQNFEAKNVRICQSYYTVPVLHHGNELLVRQHAVAVVVKDLGRIDWKLLCMFLHPFLYVG